MKKQTVIELNEKELAEALAKHFNLDVDSAKVSVYKYEGDQREPSYTKVTLTADLK